MSSSKWEAHTLIPPTQWRAGFVGSGDTAKPFFFDCCECGADEPPIAGVIALADQPVTLATIGVRPVDGGPMIKSAMYCESCWTKYLAEHAMEN